MSCSENLLDMRSEDLKEKIIEEDLGQRRVTEFIENDERTDHELHRDVIQSEGGKILKDIRSIYTALSMVEGNYKEFDEERDGIVGENPEEWQEKSHDERQERLRKYLRRLHNYAASVYTLEKHFRTFQDKYKDQMPELRTKYSNELAARGIGVKTELLSNLRHYVQKNWIPPVVLSTPLSESAKKENSPELFLKRDELLEWGSWNKKPREYIENLDEEIYITQIGAEYQEEIGGFVDWFRSEVVDSFEEEIIKTVTAEQELISSLDI